MARRPRGPLTPAKAKRAIAFATVVAPLVAPYAATAAARLRHRWDARKARQLGIGLEQLSSHTGRGGALQARVTGIASALTELRAGQQARATGAAREFAATNESRLLDLSAAVRAAEQMPADRRRATHRAVAGELNRIEDDLLTHLGVQR